MRPSRSVQFRWNARWRRGTCTTASHRDGCDGERARYTAHPRRSMTKGEGGMIGMRRMMIGVGLLLCTQASMAAAAQSTLAGQVAEGCKKDLETHCKGVT